MFNRAPPLRLRSACRVLFRAGTDYYDYAVVFAEQRLIRENIIEHLSQPRSLRASDRTEDQMLTFRVLGMHQRISCADRPASRKKSDGEMDFCKGHTFYEVPRPCRYLFREGVVMEDGSTLAQTIEFLEQRFIALLGSTGSQTAI